MPIDRPIPGILSAHAVKDKNKFSAFTFPDENRIIENCEFKDSKIDNGLCGFQRISDYCNQNDGCLNQTDETIKFTLPIGYETVFNSSI